MQPICTHKIGVHSATASHAYPVIRLPREYAALAGEAAHIYQTEHEGKLAFFIAVDKSVGKFCANLEQSQVEARLSTIESEIRDLKSALLLNKSSFEHENRKQKAEGEIRTRVVASTGP